MKSTKLHTGLRALTFLIYLSAFAAMPAFAAPAKSASPAPSASPAASPAAEAKAKPFPFPNTTIVSVDKATQTFKMGKKTVHQVHVTPETKMLKGDETPATFDAIIIGMEVRGSVKKRADVDYDAVSVKIGPKMMPSPAPSPVASPTSAPKKK